ncbi:hypothetical protein [Glycomyces xiaoerkulensis]|uniref:hypothetical protein n=1 Tax=Glycomyces xiaoerkulensis TaxID=2038139 RepID=UPI0013000BA9|nr:hypothetical protein [Glycomyces xiaoerkulensis]
MGVTIVGETRVRVLFDPDWGSLVCLRVAPGEIAQYLGVVTGANTGTPNLHLMEDHGWRFPTPELRESMRRTVVGLYRNWQEQR